MVRAGWLLVLLIVGSCADDGGGGGGVDSPVATTAHRFCVDETNHYRAIDGKPAVAHSAQLEAYANTGCGIFQSGTSATIVQDFGR